MPVEAQRSALARQLAIAIATPVVMLVVLGAVLGRQVLQMSEDAGWVDHTDEVIGTATETSRQIVEQESALRGYLISEDTRYLEPFNRVRPLDGFVRLEGLVADNPQQQARMAEARRRYAGWLDASLPIAQGRDLVTARSKASMEDRRIRMDAVRDLVREGIGVEEALRKTRSEKAARSLGNTKLLFVSLLAASAVILGFFSRRQLASVASAFQAALRSETESREAVETEAWIRAGQAQLGESLQGELSIEELGAHILKVLTAYAHADVGAIFTKVGGGWHRKAGFALDSNAAGPAHFAEGEGIIGRAGATAEVLHVRDLPPDFLKLRSGTGEGSPNDLVVVPASVDGATNAVLELGFLRTPPPRTLALLHRVGDGIALAIRSCDYKQRLRELLEEAQRQTEELQTQQEELRVANEELEAQTIALQTTQKQLETQQAELEQTNDHLAEQAKLLERQNLQLGETHAEIAVKAKEVERASQFKSEFLSNMSHELRTPLNSSLILAKLLADNKDGNLTAEQVKFAETIHAAGNDLLTLINDILDLSKIESGKMDVHPGVMPLERLRGGMLRMFEPIANQKSLRFTVTLGPELPQSMETDAQRLEQIVKNLLSNALKFTEHGEVALHVAAAGERADRIVFTVRDTGIGIPAGQIGLIFEAFRQADGTTNRKFGGTGLGLSISRELARLLGGDISVVSESGKGSTFTLTLPRVYAGPAAAAPEISRAAPVARPLIAAPVKNESPPANDDGDEQLEPGKRIVLMIEDDTAFARILVDVAREAGFQCLVSTTALDGFRLAKKHVPTGIVLDMNLPDHTGLSVLDRLKRDPSTRHIPVHIISASDYVETALAMGAAAYLMKPVAREQLVAAFQAIEARSSHQVRRVLVVDDDADLRESVAKLLGRTGVEIRTAATVEAALRALREETFDCVVTDLGLPGQSGYDLLESMAKEELPYSVPPVIVYTGRALTSEEEQRLRKFSSSIIVKGARSPERLLDEVTLFLHQVESELPADQQRLLKQARHREAIFEGRSVLVVEDDVRNVYALTSILEPKGMRVVIARNGKEGLAALARDPAIDLVLMDLMMPEMDGLEATREIRKNPKWGKLPVIALTAKAMRDDQERCMAAGANDYLAKPLDIEMLLSLLRVWMPKT